MVSKHSVNKPHVISLSLTHTHSSLNTHVALICPAVRHSFAVVSGSSRQIERSAAGMNRLYCAPVKVAMVVSQGDLSSQRASPQGATQGTSEDASTYWRKDCIMLFIKGNVMPHLYHMSPAAL